MAAATITHYLPAKAAAPSAASRKAHRQAGGGRVCSNCGRPFEKTPRQEAEFHRHGVSPDLITLCDPCDEARELCEAYWAPFLDGEL